MELVNLLFKQDCSERDYEFGCEILAQQFPQHASDSEIVTEHKKKRKKRHQAMHTADAMLEKQTWSPNLEPSFKKPKNMEYQQYQQSSQEQLDEVLGMLNGMKEEDANALL